MFYIIYNVRKVIKRFPINLNIKIFKTFFYLKYTGSVFAFTNKFYDSVARPDRGYFLFN